jgi:hypothetical protein
VSFVGESTDQAMVPDATTLPKVADFKGWTELLADHLAPGASVSRLRSYLKKVAGETWDLVNWLTHAKNAGRLDAEIALKAVEHLLGLFTAARMRFDRNVRRCWLLRQALGANRRSGQRGSANPRTTAALRPELPPGPRTSMREQPGAELFATAEVDVDECADLAARDRTVAKHVAAARLDAQGSNECPWARALRCALDQAAMS